MHVHTVYIVVTMETTDKKGSRSKIENGMSTYVGMSIYENVV